VQAHVLVPVKRLNGAKTRLAAVLSPGERADLMLGLLDGVAAAVRGAGVERITLVTSEQISVDGVARFDDRSLPWNDALAAAMREAVIEELVAVVSADLPLLCAEEVRALLAATPARGIAIARARDGGTNAVAMRPPGTVATCFGEPQSAALHERLAQAAGVEAVVIDLPGLAFDIDTPEDLAELRCGRA
jgi:2-phospho-L-lactate/phosphoenolpyruvate guanylyltransferase